jgi:hypothetical protein
MLKAHTFRYLVWGFSYFSLQFINIIKLYTRALACACVCIYISVYACMCLRTWVIYVRCLYVRMHGCVSVCACVRVCQNLAQDRIPVTQTTVAKCYYVIRRYIVLQLGGRHFYQLRKCSTDAPWAAEWWCYWTFGHEKMWTRFFFYSFGHKEGTH